MTWMSRPRSGLALSTTLVALATFCGVAVAADLEIEVKDVRDAKGKVMVALHAPKDGVTFPDFAGAVSAQWRLAEPGTLRFSFRGLKPGRYAVAVYHDENGNNELDRNPLGMPTEGYGFSRDAKGFAGPPKFDDAAVDVADTSLTTSATLGY